MGERAAAEVVVVGGGVIGSAIGYELARQGVAVTLVEAATIAAGASGASAGGVRQQGRDLRELPIALRAIRRWPHLAEELGADLHYRQDGNLTLAERPEDVAALERRVAEERALGLDVRMIGQAELRELVPDIAPTVLAASWCPSDGHAMPSLVTHAFARAATRLGARILQQTQVTGISHHRGQVASVTTTRGQISCRWVVNAAGAWSAVIARMVGLRIPIEPRALQMLVTEPMPPRLRPVLGSVHRPLSLKQLPGGSYLIGGGWPGRLDLATRRTRLLQASIAGSVREASAVYPLLGRARLERGWAGIEAIAVDEVPILGMGGEVERFVFACGFSGHGFALAPAIGQSIAELITEGRSSLPLDALSPARFGV
ncbi:FAD-binding oxidoreductase [Thermomicrobiaceae bacterium CFH 74404]|uniref:FAD-binding oxidoreductase n=1 Tax=Thermalbibacter longus TaxID=2951981 RepID=A0AA41WBD5_9BACT|nr:FAD-binding oxidoreductase [Thermalbibacter longus]MCM8747698.1 FAD-binding oxidoreductase [Thermalbibacter longus]